MTSEPGEIGHPPRRLELLLWPVRLALASRAMASEPAGNSALALFVLGGGFQCCTRQGVCHTSARSAGVTAVGEPSLRRLMVRLSLVNLGPFQARRGFWLLTALWACGDARTEVRQYLNEGGLCLSPQAEGGTHVQVLLNDCESACAAVRASCIVTVAANVVDVTAVAHATRNLDAKNDCPTVCQPVEAQCALPTLPDGSYELRYGERTIDVQLPLARPTEALPAENADACSGVMPLP